MSKTTTAELNQNIILKLKITQNNMSIKLRQNTELPKTNNTKQITQILIQTLYTTKPKFQLNNWIPNNILIPKNNTNPKIIKYRKLKLNQRLPKTNQKSK